MNQREVSLLPSGWTKTTIEQLFAPLEDGRTLHQGWSPQCEKRPSDSEAKWGVLRTTAIQPGAFVPEENKCLPAALAPRPQIEVKPGDILITCAGPRSRCGIACLVRSTRKKLMMSGKMYRFRVPDEHFEARFVEGFLQTSIAYNLIDRMKTGSSDSGLNLTHDRFRQLEVPVAPLNEQRRIVDAYEELLSDLDAGVAVLERVRDKLKVYRASVLKAAVEGALTAEWRARHPHTEPASELLKLVLAERRRQWEQDQIAKFKAKGREASKNWKAKYKEPIAPDTIHLPPLPDGWCWATIDQVTSGDRSCSYGVLQPGRHIEDGTPLIRVGDINLGKVDETNLKRIAPSIAAEYERTRIEGGELLITLVGTIGRTAVAPYSLEGANTARAVGVIPLSALVLPQWVELWFRNTAKQNEMTLKAHEVARKTLNLEDVRSAAVALPTVPEQEAIIETAEDQLSVIDHVEADLDAKLKNAQGLRQAILRHAFAGQLVPQDPKDEPASELLKRIAAERESRTREPASLKCPDKASKASAARTGRRGRPAKSMQRANNGRIADR